VCGQLGVDMSCATNERRLPWAPETDFAAWSAANVARAEQLGIDHECAKWLKRRHGKRAEQVLDIVAGEPQLAERIVPALPFIYADLLHCARNEMVIHPDDLLRRRMPLLILSKLTEDTLRRITETVASSFDWDEAAKIREVHIVLDFGIP
jgi:glycerol-3-phosphate dehydrogenase